MLFNSKQLSHEIKIHFIVQLKLKKKKKDFLKALFMHTSLLLGSDQNTSPRRAHHFSEADVLPKATLATLIFKRKSSAPAPVLILQGSSFTTSMQLHKDEDLEELAGDVSEDNFWDRRITTSVQQTFLSAKVGKWALVPTIDTHGVGVQVNKNFTEFSWLKGNSRITVF